MNDDGLIFNPNVPPTCLDPNKTVIAQYANSPTMLYLINAFGADIKVCQFFDEFYEHIWDIRTANGLGLNIWGIIVGVTRTVKTLTGFFWGYNEETLLLARPYYDITGHNKDLFDKNPNTLEEYEQEFLYQQKRTAVGMFRDFQELYSEITFDDTNFRKLILAKAHANISNYTSGDLNRILMLLFGYDADAYNKALENNDKLQIAIEASKMGRKVYVRDNFNMSMTLVFNWVLSTDEVALVMNAGVLFKPAGVELLTEIDVS